MILTGSDPTGIVDIRRIMSDHFKLKELGDLSYFLGIQVSRSSSGIFIHQEKYVVDLLKSVKMLDSRPCATPMESNLRLSRDEGELVPDPTLFRKLVGSMIYLAATRP
ncbi:Retrovirus-related Pol polyprotein from transposon RE2, partial [Linum perenne]